MLNRLSTSGKYAFTILLLSITANQLQAQQSIIGPQCIIPGITYQYAIHFNGQDSSTTKVCVTGGTLVGGGRCTADTVIPASVFVVWNDTTRHQLDVLWPTGNTTLAVQTTEGLNGGDLADSTRIQLFDSTKSTHTFICSAASGGSCNPEYVYQWQRTENGMMWTDIGNATGKDLLLADKPLVDTYFRRVTTETKSNTIAYSDMGALYVIH